MFKNGHKHSEETKKKISEKAKARKHQPQEGFQKGHKCFLTAKDRKKISQALKGKAKPPRSEQHKLNLSKSHLGKMTGNQHPRWKGGKFNRSGYIFTLTDNGNYIREHRLVAEKYLNRSFNGIKTDNRPENLYLFNNEKEHQLFEQAKIKQNLISNIITHSL